MADVVQWHSRRVAPCVLVVLSVLIAQESNGKRWKNRKVWTKSYTSRKPTIGAYNTLVFRVFTRCRRNETDLWTSSKNWKVASRSSRPSATLWGVTQIPLIERVFWLVDSYQHIAKRSHVKYEFTNTKKLVKKLARIEASSICRQQFANVFADCFCAVHTHQLEFANKSLPTLVCRLKAALDCCQPLIYLGLGWVLILEWDRALWMRMGWSGVSFNECCV